jgi:hypothetical protein
MDEYVCDFSPDEADTFLIRADLNVAQRDLAFSPGHKELADFGLDRDWPQEPAQDEGSLPSIDL